MFQGSYGYGNGYVSENVDIPCDPLATSPEIMRIDHVDAGLPSNAEPMSSNVPSNNPPGNIRPVDQDSQESCSTRDMSENGNYPPGNTRPVDQDSQESCSTRDMSENGNYPPGNTRPVDQDSQESCSTRDMSENGNYPPGNTRPVDQDSQESCSTRDMSENGIDMPERANDMTENGNESVPEKPASLENVKSYQINVDVGLSSNAAPGPSVEPVEPGKPASLETVKNDQKNADAGLSSNAAPAPGDIQENKEQAKELPGSTGKSKNMSVVINKNHTVHVKLDNFTYDNITDTIIVKNEKEFYQELQLGAGDTQLKTRAKKIKELRKKTLDKIKEEITTKQRERSNSIRKRSEEDDDENNEDDQNSDIDDQNSDVDANDKNDNIEVEDQKNVKNLNLNMKLTKEYTDMNIPFADISGFTKYSNNLVTEITTFLAPAVLEYFVKPEISANGIVISVYSLVSFIFKFKFFTFFFTTSNFFPIFKFIRFHWSFCYFQRNAWFLIHNIIFKCRFKFIPTY
jgi:hypothetical protein